ncbi:MAG: agmatine deiminase family protein [Planctomycetota bacterium]
MIKMHTLFLLTGLITAFAVHGNPAASAADSEHFAPAKMQQEWERNNPDSLPIWLTPDELTRLHEIGRDFAPTAPPSGVIRQAGEFETMEGVLIRYPFGISYAVIAEMSQDVEVVTVVATSSQQNTVHSNYVANGVNTANCSYLIAASDSYWTRDYGPWFITNNGNQGIVDTIYNRPRPNDDVIPTKFGQANGIPVFAMSFETAGGNYMCDGHGIGMSTDLTWDENTGMTHAQVYQMMEDYLGITDYHVIPDALGQYIKHIDCFAKLLSPDTIMIIEVPPSHSQYTELEEAVDYFETHNCCYGWPYNVVRVYTPNGQPYVNSLILTGKVLVPQTGSSWDDDAIASYEAAMPGYEVLGFTGSWVTTDALHCRTMGITDSEMLYIYHTPLRGNVIPVNDSFHVEAEIIALSGQAFVNGTPKLYWKTTGGWNTEAMTSAGGDLYEASIPAQISGTTIQYYINAQDASGRSENQPYTGAPAAYAFTSYDPVFGADTFEISERFGGQVNFSLNAGVANGLRNYIVMGGASGTSPGFLLPGGYATLPLNWDIVTDVILSLLNTPYFSNFLGQLDGEGRASAQLNIGPLPTGTAGTTLYFAFALNNLWDFASDPLAIEVVN